MLLSMSYHYQTRAPRRYNGTGSTLTEHPPGRMALSASRVSVVRWFETLLAFWSGGSGSLGWGLNYAAFG
jgi:hypothetical protein